MSPTKCHFVALDDSLPEVPLREKAELRLLVEKDVRFAKTLEKANNEVQKLHLNGEKGDQTFLALLAKMMWRTLQILWDLEERESSIPKLRNKQKNEVVLEELKISQEQMRVCRRAYLKELSILRDRLRDQEPGMLDRINKAVYHEDPVMYYEPLQFVEDDRIKMFVAEVVEEKLKLIISQKFVRTNNRPSTAPDKSRAAVPTGEPSPMEAILRSENMRHKDLIAHLEARIKDLLDENAEAAHKTKILQESESENVVALRSKIERLEQEKQKQAEKIKSLNFQLKDIQQSISEFQGAIKPKEGDVEEELKDADVTNLIEDTQRRRSVVWKTHFEELTKSTALEISTLERQDNELQAQIAAEEAMLEKAKDDTEQKKRAMSKIAAAKASLKQLVAQVSAKRKEMEDIAKRAQPSPDRAAAVASWIQPQAVNALSRFKNLKCISRKGEEANASVGPEKGDDDMKQEVVGDKLEFSFGVVRLMLTKSRAERAELLSKNAALVEELRVVKEKLAQSVKPEVNDSDLRAKLELAIQENERLKQQALESDNAELEQLRELVKKKNVCIKELEDELKRYQLMTDELMIQLSEQEKLGTAQPKGVRRVDFGLNFRQPQGERNVFDRLYRDAIERLARMEYLRQRFITEIFKMEPMLYRMSEDVPGEYSAIVNQSELTQDLEFLGVPKLRRCMPKRMERVTTSYEGLTASMSVVGERARGELDRLYPLPSFARSRTQRPSTATGYSERKVPIVRRNPTSRPRSAALLACKRSLPLLLGPQ